MEHGAKISRHYACGDLLDAITDGIDALGKTPGTVTIDDLAPVDEFHIGGREATRDFLGQLGISSDDHVLDVGCGIGGASRFTADEFKCRVTGVDLTDEYVRTGATLCEWLGLGARIRLVQGDVLELDVPDAAFDKAFMLHVGMNIPDKAALASEIFRILKPGGLFGIYDIMKMNGEMTTFPVPWATEPESSSLGSPEKYKNALSKIGFEMVRERNRGDFALEFFANLKARAAAAGGPPPLGLHLIMGAEAPSKIQNMIENIAQGTIAPVEMIVRRL